MLFTFFCNSKTFSPILALNDTCVQCLTQLTLNCLSTVCCRLNSFDRVVKGKISVARNWSKNVAQMFPKVAQIDATVVFP